MFQTKVGFGIICHLEGATQQELRERLFQTKVGFGIICHATNLSVSFIAFLTKFQTKVGFGIICHSIIRLGYASQVRFKLR